MSDITKLNETLAAKLPDSTLTRSDFKTEEEIAAEKATRTPSDFEALYVAQKAETERLNAILAAARITTPKAPSQSVKAPVTAAHLRAHLGATEIFKMSRGEKLLALGIDPASVTDDGLKQLFGRGNDGKLAHDLQRESPQRYAKLREAALLLDVYGA